MLCPNCKKEIDNDSTFCEFCGLDLRKKNSSNAGLIVGIILGVLVLVGGGIFAAIYFAGNSDSDGSDFPDKDKVVSQIKRFSRAVDMDDFGTISDCYAEEIERYHNDRNTSNQSVVKDYRNYNKTFGVYNKRTSIRDGSFDINLINDSTVSVVYIEDFHIDRYDENQFKDFVLKKHVKMNKDYRITSIYDDQLEKYK